MKVAQLLGLQGPWWHQVCKDTDCLCHRSYGPIRVFFQDSCSWQSEGLFGQSFSIAPPIQAHRGVPLPGVLLCCSVHQAFDGPASLLFSCQCWLGGGRQAMVMAPPTTCDSEVSPCFHGCLAFLLHRYFPPQSPPLYSLDPSLCSQQQPLPWDYSTIHKLQLPGTVPSRGSMTLSKVCMAVARTV